jgi:hypothetical protein
MTTTLVSDFSDNLSLVLDYLTLQNKLHIITLSIRIYLHPLRNIMDYTNIFGMNHHFDMQIQANKKEFEVPQGLG